MIASGSRLTRGRARRTAVKPKNQRSRSRAHARPALVVDIQWYHEQVEITRTKIGDRGRGVSPPRRSSTSRVDEHFRSPRRGRGQRLPPADLGVDARMPSRELLTRRTGRGRRRRRRAGPPSLVGSGEQRNAVAFRDLLGGSDSPVGSRTDGTSCVKVDSVSYFFRFHARPSRSRSRRRDADARLASSRGPSTCEHPHARFRHRVTPISPPRSLAPPTTREDDFAPAFLAPPSPRRRLPDFEPRSG